MITYTYRYKIKPTKQQLRQFEQYLDICRSVYDISIGELISQFFEQGVALTWDAFEHEAKQKREDDQ